MVDQDLRLDFETRSGTPISEGLMKYFNDPEADIVMLTWRVGKDGETKLWLPGMPIPEEFSITPKYAHNAMFDILAWNMLGPKYGFQYAPPCTWIDVMGLCSRFAYPMGLDAAGKALKVKVNKNPRGKALIKKICVPPYIYTQEEFDEFISYALDDTTSMSQVIEALPRKVLEPMEQWCWLHTQAVNLRGIPVDVETARHINEVVWHYKQEIGSRLPELTEGRVTAATQIQRIKKECDMYGVKLPDMQAPTIERYLDLDDAHPVVAELLTIRSEIGGTATKKYEALLNLHYKGRLYFNIEYHVATTGRFGGRGFQIHNLPRAKAKNPEELIQKFLSCEIEANVVLEAKKLIRSMIKASKGKKLMVNDYDSIETVLLMWLVDDTEALEILAAGDKLYYHMAAYLYGLDPKQIDKSTPEYAMGKALVLGCGYGMGWKRFMEVAKDYKLYLSEFEARQAVEAYRTKYYRVRAAWYGLKNLIEGAVKNYGITVRGYKCAFTVRDGNLWLTLPSGRDLFYEGIEVTSEGISHMGLSSLTYQWDRRYLTPGRIMENIIQALARDYLIAGHYELEMQMPEAMIIGHVHDEDITEIDEELATEENLKRMQVIMCPRKGWMETIPMLAAGYIGDRFKKD